MKFLHNRKQVGVVALLSVLLGAAALVMGAGSASADTCGMTNGSLGDATVYVPGVVAADLDANTVGGGDPGFYLCVVPPGQGIGVGVHDASTGAAGYQVDFLACGSLTPGCRGFEDTGAEVAIPATTTSTGTSTPGGSAGTGTGTCVYANGTTPAPSTTCPSGVTVAGINIATDDASTSTRTVPGGCVGAAGNPCITTVPSGAAVTAGGGDSTNDTVDGDVAIVGPVNHDVAKTCVVNVFTDCTTP